MKRAWAAVTHIPPPDSEAESMTNITTNPFLKTLSVKAPKNWVQKNGENSLCLKSGLMIILQS
jgi:hypothetical protein